MLMAAMEARIVNHNAFSEGCMICNSSIVFFGLLQDAKRVNLQLNEGEDAHKPLSVNHF